MTKQINGYKFNLFLETPSDTFIKRQYIVSHAGMVIGKVYHRYTGAVIPHPGGSHRETFWIGEFKIGDNVAYHPTAKTMSEALERAILMIQKVLQ